MNQYALDAVEFAENPEPRCACVLLLDVSVSMRGEKIDALNKGLQLFQAELILDDLASKRVEVAIVTFGGKVEVVQDFITVDRFQPPMLVVSGSTPMGSATLKALEMIRNRKALYRSNGIAYYRPWIFLLSDGQPTDEWRYAAQCVRQEEQTKGVAFFAVGVENANMGILSQISVRQPVKLIELNFGEMFQWLSNSLTSVSHSKIDEQIPLQAITGWAVV